MELLLENQLNKKSAALVLSVILIARKKAITLRIGAPRCRELAARAYYN